MKKILIILTMLLSSIVVKSQAPQNANYFLYLLKNEKYIIYSYSYILCLWHYNI